MSRTSRLFLAVLVVAGADVADTFAQARVLGPDYGTFARPYTGGGFRRSRRYNYNYWPSYYYGGYVYPSYVDNPPVYYPPPPEQQALPTPPPQQPAVMTATIDLYVPANAEVWFEGRKTNQTGTLRKFITPPLTAGVNSAYELKVRWTDAEGEVRETTRKVDVQPGGQVVLNLQESAKR
jgi:uncharacterized protein (TIGR03000 family)